MKIVIVLFGVSWSRKGHVTYQNGLSIEWCTMKIELGNLIWYLMMKTRCYRGLGLVCIRYLYLVSNLLVLKVCGFYSQRLIYCWLSLMKN